MTTSDVTETDPGLDRDVFLRSLVRELAGALEDTVGLDDASGYMAVVGQRIGEWLDHAYRRELAVARLDRGQVADVLADLKSRIEGTFELVDDGDDVLTYHNGRCPFEDKVLGRPSMCMMTSNVFGAIAAENLGYARVELSETIARGDGRCVVRVHLDRDEASDVDGREYFAADD